MKTVVATGCPIGGWEMVLPVLAQMGLEPAGDELVRWQSDFSSTDGLPDLQRINEALQPPPEMIGRITELQQRPSVETLFLADSRNLQLLDFWAEKFPQAKFLLFYTLAEMAVTEAILKGFDLEQSLDVWQEANLRLLHFQRYHRQQALLFDAEAVVRKPRELIPVCEQIGLTLQCEKDIVAASTQTPPERVFAAYWIASQPAVQFLQAELEASAHPMGDPLPPMRLQAMDLLNDFKKHQGEKNDRLRRALQESRQAVEKHNAKAAKSACRRRAELKNLQLAHKRLKADHSMVLQENGALLQQLQRVQEELEAVFQQKRQLEEERSRNLQIQKDFSIKEKAAEKRGGSVAAVRKSVLWKAGAPLRALMKPLRRSNTKTQEGLIRNSGFFDAAWYLKQYPDAKKNGADPAEHYLRFGAARGYNPSPGFDTKYYLKVNPDVAKAGMNPLVHYIRYGKAERRSPTP